MNQARDYYAIFEDPTYDQDGSCVADTPVEPIKVDTGSVAFAQMIEQLTRKPELEFD
jgi:hypothetical protein